MDFGVLIEEYQYADSLDKMRHMHLTFEAVGRHMPGDDVLIKDE